MNWALSVRIGVVVWAMAAAEARKSAAAIAASEVDLADCMSGSWLQARGSSGHRPRGKR
jgi:hypothetical protein